MTDFALFANFVMPRHNASMEITHNHHLGSYHTVAAEIDFCPERYGDKSWVSPEERQKAIDTNELWTCQWYPDTPVGFNILHASSYEALMGKLWETENARMMLTVGKTLAPPTTETTVEISMEAAPEPWTIDAALRNILREMTEGDHAGQSVVLDQAAIEALLNSSANAFKVEWQA